jgi:hypothetical protein
MMPTELNPVVHALSDARTVQAVTMHADALQQTIPASACSKTGLCML